MVAPNEKLHHKGTPPGLQGTGAGRAFSTYSAGVIQPNSRIYFLQDADWNTTAIVGYNSTAGTWGVTQRYIYSPYGTITVLNGDWSTTPAGTQPLVDNLYQGMTLDSVTGLYDERFRNYSPELGTWISQDPAGYINGANTYQFVEGNPAGNVDAAGLAKLPGVQVPVLVKTGATHTMPGGRYYQNFYYTQSLGIVITSGEAPDHILLFKIAEKILHGLTEIGPVGFVITEIAKSITDNGDYSVPYKGHAFPEITKVVYCESGKVQSVTVKEWQKTRWVWDTSQHGQMYGGFVLSGAAQDRNFLKSLVRTVKALVKQAKGG